MIRNGIMEEEAFWEDNGKYGILESWNIEKKPF